MTGSTFPHNPEIAPEPSQHSGWNTNTSGFQRNTGNWNNNKNDWKGKGGGSGFPRKPKPEEIDPTLYLSAAVTGNKEAPPEVLEKMKALAKYLEEAGFTIRTGMDGPIEEGVGKEVQKKEMLLPWREFNGYESKTTFNIERAHAIAKHHHPTFDQMKKGIQHVLAKNARLVMGDKMMSPATLLLVWTEDGAEKKRDVTFRSGYAAHPIRIACSAGVPVFNLGNPTAEQRLKDFINSLE